MPRFKTFVHGVLIFALVTLACVAILIVNPVKAETLSPWGSTTAYPIAIGTSCSTSSGYIYCVGGVNGSGAIGPTTNAVYFAPISSSGVGTWTVTTPHPTPIAASCSVSSGYIYCVGGQTSAVYFAPVSSSGVGAWANTTAYPINIGINSCAVSSGYIYCVGGQSPSSPTNSTMSPTSAVYYASVSSSGVGTWTSTIAYPTATRAHSCAVSSGFIYCVGGQTSSGTTGSVYYAPLSSSGVGPWAVSAAYPTIIAAHSCATSSGYLYCIGGNTNSGTTSAVYYASVSSSGVGPWSSTAPYPTATYFQSCATFSGYVYCVGGTTNSGLTSVVYYSEVLPLPVSTTTSTQVSSTTNLVTTSAVTSVVSSSLSSSSSATVAAQGAAGIPEFVLFALIAVILILAGGVLVIGLTTARKRMKGPTNLLSQPSSTSGLSRAD